MCARSSLHRASHRKHKSLSSCRTFKFLAEQLNISELAAAAGDGYESQQITGENLTTASLDPSTKTSGDQRVEGSNLASGAKVGDLARLLLDIELPQTHSFKLTLQEPIRTHYYLKAGAQIQLSILLMLSLLSKMGEADIIAPQIDLNIKEEHLLLIKKHLKPFLGGLPQCKPFVQGGGIEDVESDSEHPGRHKGRQKNSNGQDAQQVGDAAQSGSSVSQADASQAAVQSSNSSSGVGSPNDEASIAPPVQGLWNEEDLEVQEPVSETSTALDQESWGEKNKKPSLKGEGQTTRQEDTELGIFRPDEL